MIATLIDKHEAALRVAAATSAITRYPALTLAEIEGVAAIEADPDADPPVEAVPAVAGILDRCVLAHVWEPETSYRAGVGVVPTEENETGLWYVATEYVSTPYLTGTTEPTWPRRRGYSVSDGNVLWLARGAAPAALWDLKLAEHEVYLLKLSRCVPLHDVELDSRDRYAASQIVATLQDLVERTAPFCVG